MMSTATANRPSNPDHQASRNGSNFAGTLTMLRLYLRRDRIVLPLWVLLLSIPLAPVYIESIAAIYPTAADRASLMASIMASPAQRAMYGQVYNNSIGAVGIWKAGMFHVLIAVAAILTLIRHTRADEETGRTELINSTMVGRYASLTAALLMTFGAGTATGLLGAAGLLTTDTEPGGSLAFGAALIGSSLVFTAVAAVAAQLSPSARFTRNIAFCVLAASYTLRAVGDAGSGSLSWLSPLGWSLQVRPYAGERWWVLLAHLATATVLTLLAYRLLAGRDVGAGLIPERTGAGAASSTLQGAFGLVWRLDRGALLLWTVGLCLYGLVVGSVLPGLGEELGGGTIARDVVTRLGGSNELEQSFIAVTFSMLGMMAAAFAISLALRLHQEETTQRTETVLASAISRTRWLATHLVISLIGPSAAMLVAGMATGLSYGIAAHDVAGKLMIAVGAAAVQLPAIWLLTAVTAAIFALTPRSAPAAWGVLIGFVSIYLLGSLSGFPQWLLDLEPFTHIPRVGHDFSIVPLLWLLAINAALVAVAALAYRRRDAV